MAVLRRTTVYILSTFRGPCIINGFQGVANKMQRYTVFYFCKLLYMFRVDPPPETCRAVYRNKKKLYNVAFCWSYLGVYILLTFLGGGFYYSGNKK